MRIGRVVMIACCTVAVGGTGVAVADHIEGTSCNNTKKCADHKYWPKMTLDDVKTASPSGSTLRGSKTRSNELLGWHGSDKIYGGNKADVLWADHVGTGQPTSQWDRIWGEDGDDFIYSARGRNTIYGGAGNDAIKIRYGRGLVDCGPGRDVIGVPKSRKKNWTIRNCEVIDTKTEAQRGGGLKPLP